ncbi:hypothetical protein FQA39_LY14085 [Lamprigera yunnana]|nr:hypothetical protein FQA39_LY14085 [Lamprigera yunnana]
MIGDEVYVMQVDTVELQNSDEPTVAVEGDNSNLEALSQTSSVTEKTSPKVTQNLDVSDADDGQLCPICFDNWTTSGDHRLCALKCGHLFGYSCIWRWISCQKENTCPSCKKRTSRSEIRFIYAKKLIVLDNSELEIVKTQLDKVQEEKNKLQIELTKAICREHETLLKIDKLEKNIEYLNKALEVKQQFGTCSQTKDSNSTVIKLYMDKCLEICKESGCRVLDCFSKEDLIVVSMKSPNNVFPGFGVRKVNVTTYKPTSYIPLHLKPIRDLKFHRENPWLLSVSLDKTAKVVDAISTNSICVYNSDVPLWSCCWDATNSNIIYIGQQQSSAIKLDIRKMSEPLFTLEMPGDMSPVISIASIAPNPNVALNGGVISCKLNTLWAFKFTNEDYIRYSLPIEGPFISMSFENETQQMLLSARRNARHAYSRHYLTYLEKVKETDDLICRNVHTLNGSTSQKFLTRSCFLSYNSNYYVAAHQESTRCVNLWNVKSGNQICNVPAPEPVFDLCGINMGLSDFMVSLTDKKLHFYKFV